MTVAAWLFGTGGVVLVGIGAFFVFVRRPLLPEDQRFLERSGEEIEQLLPQLRSIAATQVREGDAAAVVLLGIAGATSIGLMTVVNFAIHSDFRWVLLAACGLWVAAIAAAVWS